MGPEDPKLSAPPPEGTTSDQEFLNQRLFDAPRKRVFRAFSDPNHLARWWGPKGFRNTFETFEFHAGGSWRIVMHGPDGKDYRNVSVFREIRVPERIVFEHVHGHHFWMLITLEEKGPKTLLRWRQVFDTAAEVGRIAAVVGDANEQNLDRLEAELARIA